MEGEEGPQEICPFYVAGKCRFGEDCRNRHPAGLGANNGAAHGARRKPDAAREERRQRVVKRGMKTAMDVIRRIQWDSNLPESRFTVGYLDRFAGVVEDDFSKFSSWGDPAAAEYEALSIPQHRIEYFKYRGVKVWDKKERLDEVFGSTSADSIGILNFMGNVDAHHLGEEEENEEARNLDATQQLRQKLLPEGSYPKDAWEQLLDALYRDLAEIKSAGSAIVPEVAFRDIESNGGRFPAAAAESVRRRGCVVVRGMLPKAETAELRSQLMRYLSANDVRATQDDRRAVKDVYWSKAQVEARQHRRTVATQKALLALWRTDADGDGGGAGDVDLSRPLSYIDRLRVRVPGNMTRLPPHVDSGSLVRWTDDLYSKCFERVFAGQWQSYDPFRLSHRGSGAARHRGALPSFFRAFQGWTALTASGPGDGTLRVLPNVKEATAFLLLRPLLGDAADPDVADAWLKRTFFTPSSLFKPLHEAMVSVPRVEPGDSVWWHPDVIHSVEESHGGAEDNTVLYIPAGPDCPRNRAYAERMRRRFERGVRPPDFEFKGIPELERDAVERASFADLSEEGRRMMGYE